MSVCAGQRPDKRQQRILPARGYKSVLTLGVLLLLGWTSALPAAAAIVREPYLQQVTSTSVTVVWRTDDTSADESRVRYGTTEGILNQIKTGTAIIPPSGTNVKDHIVTITGLTEATKYFYNVGTNPPDVVQAGGTADYYFKTAPGVGTPAPFRAWIFGDSGEGPEPPERTGDGDQERVRDAMLTETLTNPPSPDIILHAGDIAYNDGTDLEFTTNHFDMYNSFPPPLKDQGILRHTPLWPTLGNHEAVESPTAGVGPYYEAHVLPTGSSGTEAYYSFDYANVHFIVLDSMSSDRGTGDAMLTWLVSDLGATSQDWVIAYFHHPPYTKGSHDSDNVEDSGGRLTDMRENALSILEAGGVNLVLAGHSHGYERSYAIRGAYGYGSSPDFATPDFGTLLGNGNILDSGDGNPNVGGDGAYQDGTVYVVAGHGGRDIFTPSGHPVMFFSEGRFGSVLLDINGTTLTGRNVRDDGSITDLFSISLPTIPQPPVITTSGQPDNLTVTEPDPAIFRVVATGAPPLSYQWRRNDGGRFLNIPGAAGPIYTLSATSVAADNGVQFDVVVTNGVSSVTSNVATLTVQPPPNFTAYNDLAWGTGQLEMNITKITSPVGGSGLPSSGQLLDFATGLPTPVSLAVTGGEYDGTNNATQGANPVVGDALTLFNGKVSGQGAISYINQASNSLVLTFTNLDPSKAYEVAYFAHRNNYAWDRASLVTISGQEAFTNTSSAATDNPSEPGGVLFTGSNDPSTRLPADNDKGYVARFSTIDPGSDGTVQLTISFDGTAGNAFKGKYGSAVMLVEE